MKLDIFNLLFTFLFKIPVL